MDDKSPSEQIDNIIKNTPDWRGPMLARLRAIINQADPGIVEEVKWKKPSKPEGVAVWVYDGNLCMADILKNAVRLTFPKGALVHDLSHTFNARLDSTGVRAIDFYEDTIIDEPALKAIVLESIQHNLSK